MHPSESLEGRRQKTRIDVEVGEEVTQSAPMKGRGRPSEKAVREPVPSTSSSSSLTKTCNVKPSAIDDVKQGMNEEEKQSRDTQKRGRKRPKQTAGKSTDPILPRPRCCKIHNTNDRFKRSKSSDGTDENGMSTDDEEEEGMEVFKCHKCHKFFTTLEKEQHEELHSKRAAAKDQKSRIKSNASTQSSTVPTRPRRGRSGKKD